MITVVRSEQVKELAARLASMPAAEAIQGPQDWALIMSALHQAASQGSIEDITWRRVNDEPFEYAIQQDQFGDAFVKLLNGKCLRRSIK